MFWKKNSKHTKRLKRTWGFIRQCKLSVHAPKNLHFLHSMMCGLCKNATESKSGKLVASRLWSARTGPDHSCALACFWTWALWPKPDQANADRIQAILCNSLGFLWKNKTKSEVGNRIRNVYDPAQFWLHAGHNGHNWNTSESDPACLLGGSRPLTTTVNLLCTKPCKIRAGCIWVCHQSK